MKYHQIMGANEEKKKIKIKGSTDPVVPNVPEIEGNTITSISPAIRWCFTLNNWTEEELDWIQTIIQDCCKFAIIGKECGTNGTHHLQGYIEFKVKHRPSEKFDNKRIHWEKSKGNKDSNILYISKEDKDPWRHPKPHVINTINKEHFYDWENEIMEIIEEEPDDRTIHWYFSKEGNEGKTSFCKYLVVKKNALISGGKAADVKNQIADYLKTKGHTPELVVINIPRSFATDYISYESYENIKDMLFYSGKYEGGVVVGNPPHLIIFANIPPKVEKMSFDRWNIREIFNKQAHPYKPPKEEDEEFPLDEI